MKIKFMYFDGCPNSKETRKNLDTAISELNCDSQIEEVLVSSPEEAEKLMFMGSPSILIDGKDIETGKEPDRAGFTCRIYRLDTGPTGVLAHEYIKKRIQEIAQLN